ncbi:Protein kinase, partial [Teratosphaeriaceae sp. CCFEE 6253]
KDSYLVDFKCAGYERLVRKLAKTVQSMSGSGHLESSGASLSPVTPDDSGYEDDEGDSEEGEDGEVYVGAGRSAEEKEISSPYPFLDVASRLIVQLAEAND